MTTIEDRGGQPDSQNAYALGRSVAEHARLRDQARMWEVATGRLFDRVDLAAGASCLDAGCGPGEVMRLMAHRVGPTGRVVGVDVDEPLGAEAVARLHAAGHRHCSFRAHDVTTDAPVPQAPFDLVFARLLLFHLPQREVVLKRLWDAVAPGGCLVLQDYDLGAATTRPPLDSAAEVLRLMIGAFTAVGCDVHVGIRLPQLMIDAGVGRADGTDVSGRLESLAASRPMLDHTLRSLLPAALAHGVTTSDHAEATLAALARDATTSPEVPLLWPLMVGAWKRKTRE